MPHSELHPWRAIRPWERHSLVLLVAGLVYIAIGQSFISTEAQPQRLVALEFALNWFGISLSLDFWGWVFIAHGIMAIISARWPPISEKWGYFLLTGLSTAWAMFYLMGITLGDAPAQNVSGVLSWCLIAFMWWAISGLMNPSHVGFTMTEVPRLRADILVLKAEVVALTAENAALRARLGA